MLTGLLTVLSIARGGSALDRTVAATGFSSDCSGIGVELGRRRLGRAGGALFGDEALTVLLLLFSIWSGEGVLNRYPRGCIIMTMWSRRQRPECIFERCVRLNFHNERDS